MAGSRIVGTILCVCLLGLACCGDGEPEGQSGAQPQLEALPQPEKKAAPAKPIDDWQVLITFDVDVEAARKGGHVRPDADADELFDRVVEVARERVRAADLGDHWVKARGNRRFEVGFAKLAPDQHHEVVALVTRRGTLEFRIEVLPDDEYRSRMDEREDPPWRLGLWKGSATQFAAFKRSESELLQRAYASGTRYVPSQPAFRLVREAGKDGSDQAHFHLLEVPSEAETFDGDLLRRPTVSMGMMGHPVVIFEIEASRQEAFGDWTEKNVQLPLAIVLNGEFHSAPIIRSRLTTHVQVTLGTGPREQQKREAHALAAVLQAGAMPVQPTLVSVDTR
ncbi:MAG: hypothetical protein QNJ90_04005 [Planctomycetota bacterium]|nr:hypothetical protein [Planctomycetota bacterium]